MSGLRMTKPLPHNSRIRSKVIHNRAMGNNPPMGNNLPMGSKVPMGNRLTGSRTAMGSRGMTRV